MRCKHKFRAVLVEGKLPPMELVESPLPEQIPFLDGLLHASDVDVDDFVDELFIKQGPIYCDHH